jgi:hypothetical protein
LVFQYFMVGTLGALTAAGAKATVQGMCFQPEEASGLRTLPMALRLVRTIDMGIERVVKGDWDT